jgi:dihydrofolate synthase/folylpolyglutamate synthase
LDHQKHLGSTFREIAREKAGIIKPGVPVVVGDVRADALTEIETIAAGKNAPLVHAFEGVEVSRKRGSTPFSGEMVGLRTPAHDYGTIQLALAGIHQVQNAVVAVRLLETAAGRGLPLPPDSIRAGLTQVVWPGRLDYRELPGGRSMLLDAAHNADGAAALAAFLGSRRQPQAPIVFAASRDKDASAMLRALAPAASAFVFTRASTVRGADPQELAADARQIAPAVPSTVAASPRDALAAAWKLSPSIVVAGSIFLIGDVLSDRGPS